MVHVPVERIVSKWYGESEQNLRKASCALFASELRNRDDVFMYTDF
jgi:hypothetical protein